MANDRRGSKSIFFTPVAVDTFSKFIRLITNRVFTTKGKCVRPIGCQVRIDVLNRSFIAAILEFLLLLVFAVLPKAKF